MPMPCREQNADNGIIVTAPTCGAAGVLPSVLRYVQETRGCTEEQVLRALATAGILGNLAKRNASISGADCGCQGEVGVACAMAAAGLAELYGLNLDQVEYAAEIALSITWASPATPFAASCRCRVSSATPWPPCGP